jgi:hypothetical protein
MHRRPDLVRHLRRCIAIAVKLQGFVRDGHMVSMLDDKMLRYLAVGVGSELSCMVNTTTYECV